MTTQIKAHKNLTFSLLLTLSILYFYDPLSNAISTWNGAICDAVLKGISINKRILNFYILVAVLFPTVFISINALLNKLSRNNDDSLLYRHAKALFPVVVILYLVRFWNAMPYKFVVMSVALLYQLIVFIIWMAKAYSSGNYKHDIYSSYCDHEKPSTRYFQEENVSAKGDIRDIQLKHKKYINLFTTFWLSLLVFYFIYFLSSLLLPFLSPLSLPSNEAFTSLRTYTITGILKNKTFWARSVVSFIFFTVVWGLVNKIYNKVESSTQLYTYGIDKTFNYDLFNLACLSIIPVLFAFVATHVSLPMSNVFVKFSRLVTPSDSCNPLIITILAFIAIVPLMMKYGLHKCTHKGAIDGMKIEAYSWDTSDNFDILKYFFYYLVLIASLNLLIKNLYLSIAMSAMSAACVAFTLITSKSNNKRKSQKKNKIDTVFQKSLLLTWSPFIFLLYLEARLILIGKGIALPEYDSILIFTLICAFLILLGSIKKVKTSYSYLGGLVSLVTISYFPIVYQHVLNYIDYANVYEWGNYSVFWDTWVNGKIPFLDYFSAHALLDIGTKSIYAFLNQDYFGIYADPYVFMLYVLGAVALFSILQEFITTKFAALTLVVFPIAYQGMKGFVFAWIAVVTLIYIKREPSIGRFLFFWLLLLLNAFWRYDDGIYVGIACIIVYTLNLLIGKKKNLLGKFFISGLCVGLCIALSSAFYLLCNNISPIERLREWIALTVGSNDFWAMANFGQNQSPSFVFAYIFVPISAVFVAILIMMDVFAKHEINVKDMIVLTLAITVVLFIPRGIVYHNLEERGIGGVLLNFWIWVIALYCASQSKELYRERNFTMALTACVLLSIIFVTQAPLKSNEITFVGGIENALQIEEKFNSKDNDKEDREIEENRESRTILDKPTAHLYGSFQKVFDTLLSADETFLDFANVTSVYAFANRLRPFYTAQSPSLLTNEFSQKLFLEEIQQYKIPIAITGNIDVAFLIKMTDINHNIRYYKIAEYIYQHYRPIAVMGDFTVWATKESMFTFKEKLQSSQNIVDEILTKDYDFDATREEHTTHIYNIIELPWIWANLDQKRAVDNPVIQKLKPALTDGTFTFVGSQHVGNIDKGNYLAVSITNEEEEAVNGVLTCFDSSNDKITYSYEFNVRPGKNDYLFRVSQDYYWHLINFVPFRLDIFHASSITQIK